MTSEPTFDWHDSNCAGGTWTGLDGADVTEPCDCGMPELFRSASASGRSLALSEVEAAVTGLRGRDSLSSQFMAYDQMTRGGALDDVLTAISALREGTKA